MIKTRYLNLPNFGEYDVYGNANTQYYLRMRSKVMTIEEETRYWHEYGLTHSSKHVTTNALQGFEKLYSTENYYKPNYCDHSKYQRVNYPFTYCRDMGSSRVGWYPFSRICELHSGINTELVFQAHINNLALVGNELRAEAYWNLRPKFEGEVSLLNSLFELKDFRDIAGSLFSPNPKKNPLMDLANRIAGYHPSRKQMAEQAKKPFRTPPLKAAAEAQLLYSFAIVPTINDVVAILKQAHTLVDDAYAKFVQAGHDGNIRHSSHQLPPVTSLTVSNQGSINYHFGTRMRSKFTVTAGMKYNYTPRSRFNAFCTYWGLVPNAEAVWNALPFSFLADYAFTIGKSLRRMRTDKNLTAYTLNDYQESLLTVYESGRFFSLNQGYQYRPMSAMVDREYFLDIPTTSPRLIDGYKCSYYKRDLNHLPYYGPSLPTFKWPNSNQMKNVAALVRCMLP